MADRHVVTEVLGRRKDRAIAVVLGVKERECDHLLTAEAARKLRKVILDQFNDYYLLAADLVGSLDVGIVGLNEEYLRRLDEIYEFMASLKED